MFSTRSWADAAAPFRSTLAFDLDGNGISGRFYKLLASRSAVLKQTVLREWHDERLVPWVHYIPVSMSMEEVPELVAFLTETSVGRERAKRIGEQGRQWMGEGMRVEDRAVYVLRLLLEVARAVDGERGKLV
jgi:hypothetical protein